MLKKKKNHTITHTHNICSTQRTVSRDEFSSSAAHFVLLSNVYLLAEVLWFSSVWISSSPDSLVGLGL